MKDLITSVLMILVLTVSLGILYPFAVWGVSARIVPKSGKWFTRRGRRKDRWFRIDRTNIHLAAILLFATVSCSNRYDAAGVRWFELRADQQKNDRPDRG